MTDTNEPEVGDTSDNLTNSPNSWESLSDDDKKYVETKGFKDTAALLKSYREAEKSLSQKISIPNEDDTEGMNKLYSKLGRPETSDKYEFEADESIKAEAQKLLFENGLSQKQAKGVVEGYNSMIKAQQEKLDAAMNEQSEKDRQSVLSEWGDKADQNKQFMTRGVKTISEKYGISEEEMNNFELAIGTKKFMEMFKSIGKDYAEDNLSPSGTSGEHPQTLTEFYSNL